MLRPFVRPSPAAALLAMLGVALAGCAPPVTIPASPTPLSPDRATLLVRLGSDTVAMERYTRSASGIEGVLVTRLPAATITTYSVRIGADQAPLSAEYAVRRADGAVMAGVMQPVSLRYGADSVTYIARRATGDSTRAVAARGMVLPYVGSSYALFELALARLLATGRDSATFALLPLGFTARATSNVAIRLVPGDSVRVNWFGSPLLARHDGRGHLLGVDGRQTTLKVRVDRVADSDIEAIARQWSARDVSAGMSGPASTRDTVRATIGAAHVWIDYGRPALRGRDVWANGVLGDTLWRTGANAATQFSSDMDVLIGGLRVPAGTYSLFTAITPSSKRLVVNRQAGQWGTEYHPERDLLRVALRETDGAPSQERFTIALEPQGSGAATLVMGWGTRRLSVPVTAP